MGKTQPMGMGKTLTHANSNYNEFIFSNVYLKHK